MCILCFLLVLNSQRLLKTSSPRRTLVLRTHHSCSAQQGGCEQQGGSAQQGQPQLPYPWEQLADQNGQVYYSNPLTGEASWDPPQ